MDSSFKDEEKTRIKNIATIRNVIDNKLNRFALLCVYLYVIERSKHIQQRRRENKKVQSL